MYYVANVKIVFPKKHVILCLALQNKCDIEADKKPLKEWRVSNVLLPIYMTDHILYSFVIIWSKQYF